MPNNNLILRRLVSPWVTPVKDVTKGTVLTHEELDNNQIYLRGEIIYTASTSGTQLFLEKINGKQIPIDLSGVVSTADTFITGSTFDYGTYNLTLFRNDGATIVENLAGLASDVYVLSGLYNPNNGTIEFTNSTGGTFEVSGFTTGFTNYFTTGVTLVDKTLVFDRNDTLSAYTIDLTPLGQTGSTLVPLIYNQSLAAPNNSVQPAFGTHSITSLATFSNILGGNNNNLSGLSSDFSSIVGGSNNQINSTFGSIIGGGQNNTIGIYTASEITVNSNSVIGGGSGNSIIQPSAFGLGGHSFIGAGTNNTISSTHSFIGTAFESSATGYQGWQSFIGAGYNNNIDSSYGFGSSYSTILNGGNNLMGNGANFNNTILQGYNNQITGSTNSSTIIGGYSNVIHNGQFFSSGGYNIIGGGYNNGLYGPYKVEKGIVNRFNTILNGFDNNIQNSKYASVVGGAYNNISDSYYSTIGGGISNAISGSPYSSIVGGENNVIENLNNVHVIGSNITSVSANTTHVNSLNIYNTPESGDTTQANLDSILFRDTNGMVRTVDINELGQTGSTLVPLIYNQSLAAPNTSVQPAFGGSSLSSGSTFSNILGGGSNQITGSSFSTIVGGGYGNTTYGNKVFGSDYSSIGGGQWNELNNANYSTIGGGYNNTITLSPYGGYGNSIVGGRYNIIGNSLGYGVLYSTIVGGENNSITGTSESSFIGGGFQNKLNIYSSLSSIVGGYGNVVDMNYQSVIGGGENNSITSLNGSFGSFGNSIVGGIGNSVVMRDLVPFPYGNPENPRTSYTSANIIGGGSDNTIIFDNSVTDVLPLNINGRNGIFAGENNTIEAISGSTNALNSNLIGAGENNTILGGTHSSIIGGTGNVVNNSYASTINNGYQNTLNGNYDSIGGGALNNIGVYTPTNTGLTSTYSPRLSTIIGGYMNNIEGTTPTSSNTVGGRHNRISPIELSPGGGGYLSSVGDNIIGGGTYNGIYGGYSNIVGGNLNRIGGINHTSIVGGNDNSIGMSVVDGGYSAGLSFVGGGIGNNIGSSTYNTNVPAPLLFGATNYINTIVGGQQNNIFYSDTSFIGGGNRNRIEGDSGATEGAQSTLNNIVGGGENSIFNVRHSSIVGGQDNIISGITIEFNVLGRHSFIGAGYNNTLNASTSSVIVGGGGHNITISNYSAIVGGYGNQMISGSTPNIGIPDGLIGHGFIGGGYQNRMESGNFSVGNVIGGGVNNFMNNSSFTSSIVGGWRNHMYNGYVSTIVGGQDNTLSGSSYSSIIGGQNNTITGSSYSSIIGGQNNTITDLNNVHIIGSNITSVSADTAHVNNFNIVDTPVTDNSLNDLLVRDTNGQVRVRQASSFTGGTSATTATLTTKFAITTGFTQDVTLTINHGFGLSAGEEYDIVVKLRDIDNNIEIGGVIDNFQANDVDITLSQTYANVRVVIIA